ncbi:MAG: ribosome biogenesis factor YjgA [Steroidobacteraceae bacterium]
MRLNGEADDDRGEKPSKSERKRAAHAAQDLGETLIGLRDSDLEALGLPERLNEAIRAARRISSRAGGARQRQYIGKLMRDIELAPIRAALAARSEESAREAQRFKRLEAWRDRLMAEGVTALQELERWRPGLDRTEWSHRISAAQAERIRPGASGKAARELFRALRSLFAGEPCEPPQGPGTMHE